LFVPETLYLNKGFVVLLFFQNDETNRGEPEKKRHHRELSQTASEDSDVFGKNMDLEMCLPR
jgi:hypothetical protein